MKFVVPALLTLFAAPALAVVLEEAPGTNPITPVMPPRSFSPEAAGDPSRGMNPDRQTQEPAPPSPTKNRPSIRSGRPFASHEQPDLSNAEAAGVPTKKARAPRKGPIGAKSPPHKKK